MDDYEKVFAERAIDMDVARVRHVEYRNADDVKQHAPHFDTMSSGDRATVSRQANKAAGIIMVRHSPPMNGVTLQPLFAELRPYSEVRTGTKRHNFVDKNGRLWQHHVEVRSKSWEKHVAKAMHDDDHHGVNNPDDHKHSVMAKYLFPPGGRARRLDMHPWAADRLADARVVYFALEGCLKADSILSANDGSSVFSVPSVTLWNAPGLGTFADQHLRDKVVVIVPDADWEDPSKDGAVLAQALYCQAFLTNLRIDAHIAAPPMTLHGATTKGVDDYLAAHGILGEMRTVQRDIPDAAENYVSGAKRSDAVARDARMMRVLARHCTDGGDIHATLKMLGRHSRVRPNSVPASLMQLVKDGVITSDLPLVTATVHETVDVGGKWVRTGRQVPGKWVGWPTWNPYANGGGFNQYGDAWRDTPTLTLRPEFVAPFDRSRTVADL